MAPSRGARTLARAWFGLTAAAVLAALVIRIALAFDGGGDVAGRLFADVLLHAAVPTLVRGAMTDSYPYAFVDVADLGYPAVLANAVVIGAAFAALAFLATTVDRRRSQAAPRRG